LQSIDTVIGGVGHPRELNAIITDGCTVNTCKCNKCLISRKLGFRNDNKKKKKFGKPFGKPEIVSL
jgi:hypothetical protein